MPQLKKPSTLYSTALTYTRLWIFKMAVAIQEQFGSYNSDCEQAVMKLQEFLLTNIPNHIIDELCYSTDIFHPNLAKHGIDLHVMLSFDFRIVLSLYMNKNMQRFCVPKLGLRVHDLFWRLKLRSMENLIDLNLQGVCTDEILEVVGQHCKRLEFINIISCQRCAADHYNAFKLQYFVSDEGLNSLCNCTNLKEIIMTSVIRSGCGGRQMTNVGIKRLLLSLPMLARINYTDVGLLLDSLENDVERLSLVSITDYHPQVRRMPILARLCPNLTELFLTYSFCSGDCDSRSDIIYALGSSDLRLTVLGATQFPFDDAFKRFLELKGRYLKSVHFNYPIGSVAERVKIIGQMCPQLENIHLECLQPHHHDPQDIIFIPPNDNSIFCNLKCISMNGYNWDPVGVLPMMLKNSHLIRKISLFNNGSHGYIDNVFREIMETNPLKYLSTVHFLKGAIISYPFLKHFVMFCPNLNYLFLESDSHSYYKSVIEYQRELKLMNTDLTIIAIDN